ncbi:unnamed protein product [Dibothriocephalus latus]|uniref:peptidylprolyl isomerase n=1 Tax=Dibothriocephalus latus TaxID=60516 RepID=A0A3P6Q860_DIBLA|nr:unnamed protein product [Dibothriocephalus latus]
MSSFSEQIEHAQKIKNRANEYLKVGKHTLAQDMYNKLLSELLYIVTDGVKEKQILDQEMIAIHLNLALSYLRENNPAGVIENCDKVLDFNASNEKALFRKGEAFLLRGDVEQALQLFKRVQKAHPENTAAAAKVRVCENTLKKVNEQEKKMFRSAFMRLQKTGFGSSEETPKTEAPTAEAPPAEA